ncbi:MAG: TnsD family Tn7-like transposition protein [Burkholderiaceae bacterium]
MGSLDLIQSNLFSPTGILQWLPDETLFSLASRYHRLSGNTLASATCRHLFGDARVGTMHDFPGRVDEFCMRTGGYLGDPTSVIRDHTILPYYLPFRSSVAEADAIASMRGSGTASLKYRLGILTSRFRANHPLKACPECMRDDIQEHGIAYWHLSHQYPGVWICSQHHNYLMESKEKSTGVGRFLWLLPNSDILTRRFEVESTNRMASSHLDALLALAHSATSVTRLAEGFRFDPPVLLRTYLDRLKEKNLATSVGSLKLSEIGKDYFGSISPILMIPEFESLPRNSTDAISQVSRLLRVPRSGTHPLRHLFVIRWLFNEWSKFWLAYQNAGGQPVNLPEQPKSLENVAAESPQHKLFFDLMNEQDISVRQASNQVGIDVATGMVWATRAGIAISRRPKKLKSNIRIKLIADLSKGMEKSEAAEKYNISIQTVTTTLRTEIGLHDLWHSVRQEHARLSARSKWSVVAHKYPNLGVKGLRSIEPAAYAWLYRNDHAWLGETLRTIARPMRTNRSSVNWDQRDLALSQSVQNVALALQQSNPQKTVTLYQLYQEVPELKAKLSCIDRLPITKKVIASVTKKSKKKSSTNQLI